MRNFCEIFDTPERNFRYFVERGIKLSWFDVPLVEELPLKKLTVTSEQKP
jgi:hypothetical protein